MTNLIIEKLLAKTKRTDIPEFVPGDSIRVHVKIKEGDKERLQAFEGVVIARSRGPQASFTVRKISFGHGVERIFPLHSKVVDKVELLRSSKVRRAKLYYLRGLKGKAARLKDVDREQAVVVVVGDCMADCGLHDHEHRERGRPDRNDDVAVRNGAANQPVGALVFEHQHRIGIANGSQ